MSDIKEISEVVSQYKNDIDVAKNARSEKCGQVKELASRAKEEFNTSTKEGLEKESEKLRRELRRLDTKIVKLFTSLKEAIGEV